MIAPQLLFKNIFTYFKIRGIIWREKINGKYCNNEWQRFG